MTGNEFRLIGFRAPRRDERPLTRRKIARVQLIASLALVLSIAVAATAVSIGIARADVAAVSHNASLGPRSS